MMTMGVSRGPRNRFLPAAIITAGQASRAADGACAKGQENRRARGFCHGWSAQRYPGHRGRAASARFWAFCLGAPTHPEVGAEASPPIDVQQLSLGGGRRVVELRRELPGYVPPR